MGLDMYLTRRIYIGGKYKHNKITGILDLKRDGQQIPVKLNKVEYIDEEAGYWRKANEIHKWFVNNVQNGVDDCKTYDVSIEQLKELLKLCKKVKEKAILKEGKIANGQRYQNGEWETVYEDGKYIENAEEIAEILPTQSGFFFGNTDYNEFYLYDIEETITIIKRQIKRAKELEEQGVFSYLQYQSSW